MVAPSIVRVAEPMDYAEVWRLMMDAFKENAQFSLAPEKVHYFIQRALYRDQIPEWDTGPRGVIGVIGEIGGKLEGLAFINLGSFWYTNDRHIEEFIVYVDSACRKSFHARAMINWMKEQSKRTQLKLLTGVISNVRTQAKVDLYSRMVPKIGAFFLYEPEQASRALSSAAVA